MPRLELLPQTSGLALDAHGVPGISYQLLHAWHLIGPWLSRKTLTFRNTVQRLRPPDMSEPARFYRLLRK